MFTNQTYENIKQRILDNIAIDIDKEKVVLLLTWFLLYLKN